jgi:SAM-dependent methyltransferase
MVDPGAALAETRRVLRPGGRVALAVWGPPERNPWAAIFAGVLVERGHLPPPDPAAPGPFSMDEERTRSLLDGAGFGSVRVEEVPVRFVARDVDDFLRFVGETSGPVALAFQRLPERERAAIAERLDAALAPLDYAPPGLALAAVAS